MTMANANYIIKNASKWKLVEASDVKTHLAEFLAITGGVSDSQKVGLQAIYAKLIHQLRKHNIEMTTAQQYKALELGMKEPAYTNEERSQVAYNSYNQVAYNTYNMVSNTMQAVQKNIATAVDMMNDKIEDALDPLSGEDYASENPNKSVTAQPQEQRVIIHKSNKPTKRERIVIPEEMRAKFEEAKENVLEQIQASQTHDATDTSYEGLSEAVNNAHLIPDHLDSSEEATELLESLQETQTSMGMYRSSLIEENSTGHDEADAASMYRRREIFFDDRYTDEDFEHQHSIDDEKSCLRAMLDAFIAVLTDIYNYIKTQLSNVATSAQQFKSSFFNPNSSSESEDDETFSPVSRS